MQLLRATLLLASALVLAHAGPSAAQSGRPERKTKDAAVKPPAAAAPALKRTTSRQEVRRLGHGGRLTLYGAPVGSITVEGWTRGEVEVTADIELRADTEEELARLAAVNDFVLDDDFDHVRVMTTGTHDRKFMKRAARDFPKKLLSMPWRIDYRVKIPTNCDLEIYAGSGALNFSGFEGALRLNAGEAAPASFTLTGGDVEATLARGSLTLRVPARGWRGRGASFRVVEGDITLELPAGFSGDVNAEVLRVGQVESTYEGLAPRERTKQTGRQLLGRAGAGGAVLSLTVGDGTIRVRQEGVRQ
ncbi:MAG TPA: hypothetical protein VFX96_12535 [Pyrinomonadaceae bacterium]|nr:hypothetical protein [Pyrinomonadaceae bacterium]